MTEPGNFCIHPWTSIRMDTFGDYLPCCSFRADLSEYTGRRLYENSTEYFNSDYLNYIRTNILAGNKIPECSDCWKKEDAGLSSLRLEDLQFFFGNTFNKRIQNSIVTNPQIINADIKVGNLCNFSCGMCDSADSSTHYARATKQRDNEFVVEAVSLYSDYQNLSVDEYFEKITSRFSRSYPSEIDELLAQGNLLNLKILGGEPFMYPKLLQTLANQPLDVKQKIKLSFTTNGSYDMVEALNALSDYKSVWITASIEGIGKIQDYIRKGSNWETVKQNIFGVRDKTDANITLTSVIQALNLNHLRELIDFCNSEDLDNNYSIIKAPTYLGLEILDSAYIDNCLAHLPELTNYIGKPQYNPELKERFLRWVNWYEQDHKLNLKDVNPELWKYLHDAR